MSEGYMPTIREIADHFHFQSLNAVRDHLAALERKGYIERKQRRARGIELAPDLREEIRGLPIIGRVAAGQPITAIENIDGYLSLESIYDRESHYA
ncbi:MAG: GntR family transcriptional regulator, partial [Planctomycetota bacterium]|nr:GntR family transcriptional regulator [Planctomycetota bacterium]